MPIPTYNDNDIGALTPTVLYLCNGENTRCSKTNCVYSGGDCKHTTDINYAVNFKKYAMLDGGEKLTFFENENCFIGNITPVSDAAQTPPPPRAHIEKSDS